MSAKSTCGHDHIEFSAIDHADPARFGTTGLEFEVPVRMPIAKGGVAALL